MTDIPDPLKYFPNFLYLAWQHLGLGPPTEVQYDIARWLAQPDDGVGVMAFRGCGKSWIGGVWNAHNLFLDQDNREMIASANALRAKKYTQYVRRLITEWPLIQHLHPTLGQTDSDIEGFDVAGAPIHQARSCQAFGITGQLTGARATNIMGDDIEIPKNSDTVAKREVLTEAVKEFEAVLSPGGKVRYLGTPQTAESIYVKELVPKGYRFRIWPARVPSLKKADGYGDLLAPMIRKLVDDRVPEGTPIEPSRFTDALLTRRELKIGKSVFDLQYMLDTTLSDSMRYPLRCSDLAVVDCRGTMGPVKLSWASSPELALKDAPMLGFSGDRFFRPMFVSKEFDEWNGCVMTIDPKGRGKDELGYAVVKMLSGNLFIADCKGTMGGYTEENLELLAKTAQRHKVKKIIIESNFGDGMFTALFLPVLKRIYDVSVEEVKHSTQKERRIIDTLEPVMNQHRLIVDSSLIHEDTSNYNKHSEDRAAQYSLFFQLTHITKDKGSLVHDDRLDALAMAVAYWVEIMGKDDFKAVDEHRQRMFDRDLEKYFDGIGLGGTLETPNWIPKIN